MTIEGCGLNKKKIEQLITAAKDARARAYAPYSGYLVGAALLTRQDEIITGCNIENAAYGPSNCAERTAFFKAVSEGKREFTAIAIVGGFRESEGEYAAPCGVCRQVLREFVNPKDFMIVLAKSVEDYKLFTLEELPQISNKHLPDIMFMYYINPQILKV